MAKGPEAFRTISEASQELGVAQHVLRFWETKFVFVRPMKRAGGRRFYRPRDIAILANVHRLLHRDGYTIKGVQKLHRDLGLKSLTSARWPIVEPSTTPGAAEHRRAVGSPSSGAHGGLEAALLALEAAKARLDGLFGAG